MRAAGRVGGVDHEAEWMGAYDPLDPKGNITIKWDFLEIRDGDGYYVRVTMYNNQLYRHIESPGWALGWTWPSKDEAILQMSGAEATKQGNCSRFKRNPLPHSCERSPVIVDLLPGTSYNLQTANCCKGGVLSSMTQDPSKAISSFEMNVQSSVNFTDPSAAAFKTPSNFSLGIPGYTCGKSMSVVEPTKFSKGHSRREEQVLMTWQVVCSFSQFRESDAPSCCVSLSSFYNDTIVSCPRCSCGCQVPGPVKKCYRQACSSTILDDESDTLLQMPNGEDVEEEAVMCTQHMCPIRVHWHVKVSYKGYWRVKVTITNFNFLRNYSDWNLVLEHPNLRSLLQVFSFSYQPLIVYPGTNDTGMFWGIPYYNTMLLKHGENGNVQTEMILKKDPGDFTFNGGWAFPRRVMFNGRECVMPLPESYPSLPNAAAAVPVAPSIAPFIFIVLLFL
ncbi:hypothetical protein J5N97_019022 [Dioscorea zingiberensis]|uniref:COBRA-like protein n=1 Tax=Dioscorea zingiberensis TaxID=325984 RepID=A0A9D5CE46_9LILI|nr:hypothetical protein J5N97_019022 [Dioscorea zingiberensis]